MPIGWRAHGTIKIQSGWKRIARTCEDDRAQRSRHRRQQKDAERGVDLVIAIQVAARTQAPWTRGFISSTSGACKWQ